MIQPMSYGYPYGAKLDPKTLEEMQEKRNQALHSRRNASVGILWRHTLVCAGLALFGVGVGIGNIVVGTDTDDLNHTRWHIAGGSLYPGILLAVCAILGFFLRKIGREKEEERDIGTKARCLFFIQYIMYIMAGFAALTFFALSLVGILWCTKAVDTHYVKDKRTHVSTAYNTTCPNDETAAIVTASLAVVDCVAITVCGFVGIVLFHLYSKSYGLKKKGES